MPSTEGGAMKVLLYLLRRDLRVTDNPVLDEAARVHAARASGTDAVSLSGVPHFTHLLPVYVFPAQQIDVSGFQIKDYDAQTPGSRQPYAPARSKVGGFPRTGPHRAKFTAESVWDLKESFQKLDSDLTIRVGRLADVVDDMVENSKEDEEIDIVGVWMTADVLPDETQDEDRVKHVLEKHGKHFRLFKDEKYFLDLADLPYASMAELPDVYTTFRKSLEPIREKPRPVRNTPRKGDLPPCPPRSSIPPQFAPYEIPETLETLMERLLKPLDLDFALNFFDEPKSKANWVSTYTKEQITNAHPFTGGESLGQRRVQHLLRTGAISRYHETRNGLIGQDFSTKLSGYFAVGALSARWVHWQIHAFEEGQIPTRNDGDEDEWKAAPGFGAGESGGTTGVRFELLWRDYMRLCAQKFGSRLFHLNGFRGAASQTTGTTDAGPATVEATTQFTEAEPTAPSTTAAAPAKPSNAIKTWRFLTAEQEAEYPTARPTRPPPTANNAPSYALSTRQVLHRYITGTTGIGLIDASMRELAVTGYTSNRARQNCASFLSSTSHLGIDWRLGAEWYECCLVDYDGASNWGNWQYVAGVGNDPREGRVFNPVKQAVEYDSSGDYVRAWVAELRCVDVEEGDVEGLMGVFQGWRLDEKQKAELKGVAWVDSPLVRIPFEVSRKPREGGGRRARSGSRASRGRGRGGENGRGKVPWRGAGEGRGAGRGRGRGHSRGGGERGRERGLSSA